jgi:hypothetical protein
LLRPPPPADGGADGRLAPGRLLGRLDGGGERSVDGVSLPRLDEESLEGRLFVDFFERGASPFEGADDGGAEREEPRSAREPASPRLGGALEENDPRPPGLVKRTSSPPRLDPRPCDVPRLFDERADLSVLLPLERGDGEPFGLGIPFVPGFMNAADFGSTLPKDFGCAFRGTPASLSVGCAGLWLLPWVVGVAGLYGCVWLAASRTCR